MGVEVVFNNNSTCCTTLKQKAAVIRAGNISRCIWCCVDVLELIGFPFLMNTFSIPRMPFNKPERKGCGLLTINQRWSSTQLNPLCSYRLASVVDGFLIIFGGFLSSGKKHLNSSTTIITTSTTCKGASRNQNHQQQICFVIKVFHYLKLRFIVTSAVPVQNIPAQNGPTSWPPVLLHAAFSDSTLHFLGPSAIHPSVYFASVRF